MAFLVIMGISIVFLIGITAVMIYFLYKYNRKRNPKPGDFKDSTKLEIIWTVVPTVLVLIMFYFGWVGYAPMKNVPDDAMTVKVTGRMWSWSFEYENGKITNDLVIPQGKPVVLNLYSPDVLHSFYIPAFRVKEDVVPGVNTRMWFTANKPGEYDILCAEYCGTQHAYMLAKCIVIPETEYADWIELEAGSDGSSIKQGLELVNNLGCLSCHTINGEEKIGPSFKGIFDERKVLKDGDLMTIIPDEEFIKRALYEPNVEIAEGYGADMMVSYEKQLSDVNFKSIMKYLKDLNGQVYEEVKKSPGLQILQQNGCVACHSLDGSRLIGPSFKGVYNPKNVIIDGETKQITPDDEYMIRAIYDPNAEIVETFAPNMMVSYETSIDEEAMKEVLKYLKELNEIEQ